MENNIRKIQIGMSGNNSNNSNNYLNINDLNIYIQYTACITKVKKQNNFNKNPI